MRSIARLADQRRLSQAPALDLAALGEGAMGKAPKYVSAAYLAERTSLTTRWFTKQACEGMIPGAVQPAGPGGAWRFDEDRFWRWWNEKGREPWHPSLGRMGRANSRDEIKAIDDSGDRLKKLLGLPPYGRPRGWKGRWPPR